MMRILSALVVLLFAGRLEAQNFGGFPPAVKWQQLNTDTARIIFQANNAAAANRIATIVHRMAVDKPTSLGEKIRKIDIVLHGNTTLANGYVGLGPFRSEYYLVPSSNIFEQGSVPWSDHLAVHEYRHVQQYNNFNRGLTKGFSLLFGQEGRALANALTIPGWFFEGDAVHAETSLTPQGRGRLPYFLSGYKSLWQSGKTYSRIKLLNGSLKDYVPDHYQLGYMLVNHGYEKYGVDFWKGVTTDAAAFKGLIYPFRKSLQKYAGVRYTSFFDEAISTSKKGTNIKPEEAGARYGTVTNYHFPQVVGNDSLIYLKDSYKRIPAFYIKDGKGEHRIKQRSISSEDWLSYRNGLLAYTAFSTHPRWSLIDYSNIILLDIHTGKEKKLSSKAKYFTPDIAPSGGSVVAVSVNEKLETELHLLSIHDGSKIKVIKSNNRFFVHPKFIDNENIVMGIRMEDGSMSLNKMNLQTEKTEALTTASFYALGYPFATGDTTYFTAAYRGNDDLYALSIKDGKLFQLTSDQTGNYYANAAGNKLAYSNFTHTGLELKMQDKSLFQWKEVNAGVEVQDNKHKVALATQNILALPERVFAPSTYRKSTGLINFHSWRPSYADPEFSYSLYGNNVLNTFNTEIFYRYNQNERSHGTGANFSYSALFPVLRVGGEYVANRQVRIRTSPTTVVPGVLNAYEFNGGYYVPLNFTAGKTYKQLNFGNTYALNKQLPAGETKKILRRIQSPYLAHFINWAQQLPKARQNIFPKFGYAVNNAYRHRLGRRGYQLNTNAQLYLPSIANHSLVLSGAYQQEDVGNIIFSNRFSNSRGYSESDSSRMWRASANYHFPVAYPDWGFGGIIYFQRVRTNVFYDFSQLYSIDKRRKSALRSTGMELFFDTKWWNQLPVSFGIRYSYLIDAPAASMRKHQFELIIPTDLLTD